MVEILKYRAIIDVISQRLTPTASRCNVLLILPDKEGPVLTRELLYTGLTSARTRVAV